MDILTRLITSLRRKGISETLLKLRVLLVDRLFDLKYGIDTCAWSQLDQLTIKSANKDRGHRYEPTRVLALRKLFHSFRSLLPDESVLVDFGCGKGRVLFVASEFGFKEVRGVEFAAELCRTALRNMERHRARSGTRIPCRIVEGDAAKYPIARDENVFFLFNPFDGKILGQVLGNIGQSLQKHPRRILIIYHNPRFDGIIGPQTKLSRIREFSYCGCNFSLFSNMA